MNLTPFNITFTDLCFSVGGWHNGRKIHKKQILKDVSGEFRACELTAVVGPSGSGKTSLLNVLSGFAKNDIKGSIEITGDDDLRVTNKRSKYIMQNYMLHRFITVREAMKFAANLKMHGVSSTCKQLKIDSILDELGLLEKENVFCGNLSGGEEKRLSIALELVDDPSILFLDEPTTGLDASSSTQCFKLLKKLAMQGRTVICSIHTPSALIFGMFDHVYALAEGYCIYQGSAKNLVPFLSELNFTCPHTYNPADFLLEIANNEYGTQCEKLVEKIGNGVNHDFRSPTQPLEKCQKTLEILLDCNVPPYSTTTFPQQLLELLKRNYLIATRDKTLAKLRLSIHFLIAIFIGILYNGIGNDASNIYDIFKFLFFNIFLLMFTAFSSLQTSFPLDLPITRREHFNGWYSPASYYLALTIIDIPIVILTNLLYIMITYFMTSQPTELYRFGAYYITILLLSFASQGLGLIAGSLFNVKFTLILGSFLLCPFVLFSNFFIQMNDKNVMWHWLFEVSFIKHALEGSMQAIFGFNREKLQCLADFCIYTIPRKFMESLGISDSFEVVIVKLVIFTFVFRLMAFFIMRYRITR